ncbi:uncharacterized protein MYCFIDRAFT_80286 [Pseudocercospora fijiensis CIRAD86]|uniref:C3H1-type domain-containing protein n=1 Tax=Pseudocercospora fijiensis (strain CIRAD86) TaxID=383855 RepID=M2ZUH2_PSEFD|nr:uncharacterized protein MYCFIDRAFT_80286 [Pseudocercospora fijiensis CIRAD86]EME82654.1 hypothetical protein MYCFIDRAFT_80286 [Pseudocercospora fijiensis CIRAD86]
MDQNGFQNNLFADNQNFNAYDNLNLYQSGSDSNFNPDASWAVNASDFSQASQSRAPQSAPSWAQNANHLAAQSVQQGFNASPYARPMSNSPASFAPNTFTYNGQQPQQQPFQYRQPQFDPSLAAHGQNFNLHMPGYTAATQSPGTIAPQNLDPTRTFTNNPYAANAFPPNNFNQNRQAAQIQMRRADQKALVASIPKAVSGGMFNIIDFNQLSQTTNSERMGSYANVGKEAQEWDVTRSAIPAYVPRKSRNELRALAGNNKTALAKIGKKSKTLAADLKSRPPTGSVGSPSIKHDADSSSEYSSSSDDDSEYTDDEDEDSPLPAKKPDDPKGGVEYDVIKAVYRSKKKSLDAATIGACLGELWEVVKTIRDRWKADAAAVNDAETKKKAGELPLLKSRVKDQREMMETAFKAVLKHGHRDVIAFLSENVSLIFICYQFLLDRFKDEDINGSLSRAILELMSQFTTLTKDKLEKTHMEKVLPRYQKKGDAKTKYYVNKILANAETATKESAKKAEQKKAEKLASETADSRTGSPSVKKPVPDSGAGVKRPAASSAEGTAQKKVATVASKANGVAGAIKKAPTATDSTKSAAAGSAQAATRKTVVAKPSGFFSGLQSATKKPGTSNAERAAKPVTSRPTTVTNTASAKPAFDFAQTMANLTKPKEVKKEAKPEKEIPPETEEERAKRLRKEQRRKLRVSFKPVDQLVEVRFFVHDPEEEIDHDSSQMRDVADVGGEGRMFKQQQHMMDLDEDDEPSEEEQKLVEFRTPIPVDFSTVPEEERSRNFTPYGGGEFKPNSAEKSKREQYENETLMVFYTEPSQIPANPKEPEDPYNGDPGPALKYFGPMEEKYSARARSRQAQFQSQPIYGQSQTTASPAFPFAGAGPQQSGSQVQSILDTLRNLNSNAHQPGATAYSLPFVGGPAPANFQPPPPPPPQTSTVPAGQLDLAAILAQIQNGAPQAQPAYNYGASQQPTGADAAHKKGNDPKNRFYKTKVCRYWHDGKCQKGDACSYLHE